MILSFGDLFQNLGREPLPEEIADKMGLPLKEARRIIRIKSETVSLDSPIGEEGEGCLADLVEDRYFPGPLEETMQANLGVQKREAIAILPPRQEAALRLRFGIGESRDYTLKEIEERFSLTRERVRQIEENALQKLRSPDGTVKHLGVCPRISDFQKSTSQNASGSTIGNLGKVLVPPKRLNFVFLGQTPSQMRSGKAYLKF